MLAPALTGFVLGFLVGAEVGPIWLLCARTSLRHGFAPGFAVGAGAALVDTAYAALGVAGAEPLLAAPGVRLPLGLLGAAVLAVIGVRTVLAGLRGPAPDAETTSSAAASRAFSTALLATASNPLTIASWAAIFAAASAARLTSSLPQAVVLVGAVGLGSISWFAILAGGAAAASRRVGPRVASAADIVSGGGIALFAVLLAAEALRLRA